MSGDCWEQGKWVEFAVKFCNPVVCDRVNYKSCSQRPGCIQHSQCSSNGHYFGVCSLPHFSNIAAQRMLGQVYMQKDLVYLLLMAIKIIKGGGRHQGTKTPKKTKKTEKKGKEKGKVLVTSWKGKWLNSPSNTSAVEFYNALIKEPWICHQYLLKLLVGCSSWTQGLCWLEHILGRVEPWKASGPQGLRHYRHCVPVSCEFPAWGCLASTL